MTVLSLNFDQIDTMLFSALILLARGDFAYLISSIKLQTKSILYSATRYVTDRVNVDVCLYMGINLTFILRPIQLIDNDL
jgi:hypothetical protein